MFVCFFLCHEVAPTTHVTELFTSQKFRLYHAYGVTHVNVMGKQGGIHVVLTIPWPMTCHENNVESNEHTDVAHQLSTQFLVKQYSCVYLLL